MVELGTVVRRLGYTLAGQVAVCVAAIGWAVNQERRAARQPPPLRVGRPLRLPAQRTPSRTSWGAGGAVARVDLDPSLEAAAPPHRGRR